MAWFRKEKKPLKASDKRDVPGDVFEKCDQCGEILYREKLAQHLSVCPNCGNHFRITADAYVALFLDEGSFQEMDAGLRSGDPLGFTDLKGYADRVRAAEKKVGRNEAVVTGKGTLDGIAVCLAVMDFRFIGGSMGSVVGEKIARCARAALAERRPLLIVSASGGARMMEGIYSLMQLAKTSAVLARLHEARVPYISICTDPTTGGVTASYAMLGDVNLAEPGALIGFAGPRVIEETIRQELPEGFQRAEFLLEHGMVDQVVDRRKLKETVARLLRHMLHDAPPSPPAGDAVGSAVVEGAGAGDTGTAGATTAGAAGNDGTAGVAGDDGTAGAAGDDGIAGVAGDDGTAGAAGDDGTAGVAGNDGTAGAAEHGGDEGDGGDGGDAPGEDESARTGPVEGSVDS